MFITVFTILLFVKKSVVDAAGRGTFSSMQKPGFVPAFVILFFYTSAFTTTLTFSCPVERMFWRRSGYKVATAPSHMQINSPL